MLGSCKIGGPAISVDQDDLKWLAVLGAAWVRGSPLNNSIQGASGGIRDHRMIRGCDVI